VLVPRPGAVEGSLDQQPRDCRTIDG
jgi:hypothetical protein